MKEYLNEQLRKQRTRVELLRTAIVEYAENFVGLAHEGKKERADEALKMLCNACEVLREDEKALRETNGRYMDELLKEYPVKPSTSVSAEAREVEKK